MGYLNTLLEQRKNMPLPSLPEKEEKRKPEKTDKEKTLVDSYKEVKIYKVKGEALYLYEVPVPRYRGGERELLKNLLDIASRVVELEPSMTDRKRRYNLCFQQVSDIIDSTPELKIPVYLKSFYADAVTREIVGFGLIDYLLDDDLLEDILVIGPNKPVYVFHRKYEMMKTNIIFYNDEDIRTIIDKMARLIGRHIDIQTPLLDARLPDGTRVNATIPPASIDGATISLRKFRKNPMTISNLVAENTLNYEAAAFLWMAVDGMGAKPANILVAGGTASGKTTTLNILCSFVPTYERIITIEEVAELRLPLTHWVRLETRPPSIEGTGEIDMNTLVKNSLRMRPDRIIVGEIRGQEGFTMFSAMNTGHDGALTGDSLIQLSDGKIEKIEKIAEKFFEKGKILKEKNFEYVNVKDKLEVVSLNKKTLKLESKQVEKIWRKKTKSKLLEIKLNSGRKITLTRDHPLYKINEGIEKINAEKLRANDFIALPESINISSKRKIFEPYTAGLIYGDGHMDKNSIQFVNSNAGVIQNFESTMKAISSHKLTNLNYGSFARSEIWDKKIVAKFHENYDVPLGNKTKSFELNNYLLTAANSDLGEFLKGLYDCEAHVNLHANAIEFSTANADLARKLPLMLLRWGIFSSVYAQEKDGKGNFGPYYRILIHGRENIRKFVENIGFAHTKKLKALGSLVEKSGESQRSALPNIKKLVKKMRLEAGITQKELAEKLGHKTRSLIEAYETGKRRPSKKQILKIASVLNTETAKQLKILASAPLCWDKIKSIKEIDFEGYVYDFTVADNHNYIANGIVVSNCMGTVHSNSARETLIRLSNPPISVPLIMLNSLNLVVMQQRINDRRKGLIRRVTEIAEIVPSEKENEVPGIQVIYKWDPAKDALSQTGIPPLYFQTLQRFTGLKYSDIKEEMERRIEILKSIQQEGIDNMEKVCKTTQYYILKKRGA